MSGIKEGLEVAAELVKAAENDPNVKAAGHELGMAANTIAKFINVALLPLAAVNFGIESARKYFQTKFEADLSEKLDGIPDHAIVAPRPFIAGPALQGLAYLHEEQDIRELYLRLLAREMDRSCQDENHPGFVDIIRQLTPREARLLTSYFQLNGALLLQADRKSGSRYVDDDSLARFRGVDSEASKLDQFSAVLVIDNWIRLGLCRVHNLHHASSGRTMDLSDTRQSSLDFLRPKHAEESVDLVVPTVFGRRFAESVGIVTRSSPTSERSYVP